jgi:hypothetical protein
MIYDRGKSVLLCLPEQLEEVEEDLAPLYRDFLDLIKSTSKKLVFEGYPTDREMLAFLKALDDKINWWPLVSSLMGRADQAAREEEFS